MTPYKEILENCPVIAAVRDELVHQALASPAEVIFLLNASLLTVGTVIRQGHEHGKRVFVHLDLADGIGKDKTGIAFLKRSGVDGIISTRANLIRAAKEQGIATVQRFFALDSQGVSAIDDLIRSSSPDLVEIMPGIAVKTVRKLAEAGFPVIAGGLIETKAEVMAALSAGALAVSTGKRDLWSV